MRHILKSQQFKRKWLEEKFFPSTQEMKSDKDRDFLLKGKKMVTLFYEPSTRTRASFQIAMSELGGKVVFSTEHAKQFSSAAKGESIEDTIKVFDGYNVDVIVLRHPENGASERAVKIAKNAAIINGGDGTKQHPTQSLIDLYTIYDEKGRIDNLDIAIMGDLRHGRTVRSLSYLLGKFNNVKIHFIAPSFLQMKEDIKTYLTSHNIQFEIAYNIKEVAPKIDVIYQTRLQLERMENPDKIKRDLKENEGFYDINKDVLEKMKSDAIIMHPLPRVDEITTSVDKDKRAAYFRQAQNGLYVRMALLKEILC